MANTVTKTSIVDGENVGTVHIYMKSDGSTGELSSTVLLDSSALAGAKAIRKITHIKGHLKGFDLKLEFDQTSNVPIITLPSDVDFEINLSREGSLVNPEDTGTTGDVVCTTTGFTAATDEGTLIITYRK